MEDINALCPLYARNKEVAQDIKNFQETYDNWNHTRMSNITCPYCGYADQDSWEYNNNLSDQEITCGNCENEFMMSGEVEVFYSTWKCSSYSDEIDIDEEA